MTMSAPSPQPTQTLTKPTVYIVGFAPTWTETPWDDPSAERWGMNALHKVAGDKPWDRWYQLHDIATHHKEDFAEHTTWLRESNLPVIMWPEHLPKYAHLVPNAIPYPKQAILDYFAPHSYFTNTVSWMIAHAIYESRAKIGVYGVDMAQSTEYGAQRPSCEYFLGIAVGRGIEIDLPLTSDLIKTPFLYGLEDATPFRAKLDARQKQLVDQRAQVEGQLNQLQQAHQQIVGAIENNTYIRSVWTQPNLDSQGA